MVKAFLGDQRGQDIVEYSLLLVLIGVVALLALTAMGANITSIFTKINDRLNSAASQLS
jgi:Flp pilus assembly pilin Flp